MTERAISREEREREGDWVGVVVGLTGDFSSPSELGGSDTCARPDEVIHPKVSCACPSSHLFLSLILVSVLVFLPLNVHTNSRVLLLCTVPSCDNPPLFSFFHTYLSLSPLLWPSPFQPILALYFTDDRLADCNPTDAGVGEPGQLL